MDVRRRSVVARLAADGVRLNVTALMTLSQVDEVSEALGETVPSFISVFAGRIADTGRDPVPVMAEALADGAATAATPHLGQPARAAERLPGRFHWLSRHHGFS